DDIDEALGWLHGLAQTTEQYMALEEHTGHHSPRIFTHDEYLSLGSDAIGFIVFLENSGVLPPALREILIDRAMATQDSPVLLDDLKIIALIVLWSQQI